MKTQKHQSWVGRALALFLAMVAFLQAAELTPEIRKQVSAIAAYTTSIADETTTILSSLGYRPPEAETGWSGYPAIRKIEAAYHSAEAGGAGQGDKLLAILSHRINDRYLSSHLKCNTGST